MAIRSSATSIGIWAFSGCSFDLIIDFGNVGQTFQNFDANRHSELKRYTHPHSHMRASHPVRRSRCPLHNNPHLATIPLRASALTPLVDFVDGDGASLPLPVQDLSGDYYPLYYCWGHRTAAVPDGSAAPQPSFKQLAAEQYPNALANPDEWEVQLRPDDSSLVSARRRSTDNALCSKR